MLLKAEGFVDRVRQWWSSYHVHGTTSFILANELKALNRNLKIWKEQVFGNMDSQKKSLMKELEGLDSVAQCRALSDAKKFMEMPSCVGT